jgi:hypothetical protein
VLLFPLALSSDSRHPLVCAPQPPSAVFPGRPAVPLGPSFVALPGPVSAVLLESPPSVGPTELVVPSSVGPRLLLALLEFSSVGLPELPVGASTVLSAPFPLLFPFVADPHPG